MMMMKTVDRVLNNFYKTIEDLGDIVQKGNERITQKHEKIQKLFKEKDREQEEVRRALSIKRNLEQLIDK